VRVARGARKLAEAHRQDAARALHYAAGMKKNAKKLGLNRETVKQLSTAALRDAAGGLANTTSFTTCDLTRCQMTCLCTPYTD
jgi:hypothetical protein